MRPSSRPSGRSGRWCASWSAAGEFIEVFVDTPIEECIARDPKGLYAKAQAGEIKNFTGIDSPYEAPEAPELHIATVGRTAEDCAGAVLEQLRAHGIAC